MPDRQGEEWAALTRSYDRLAAWIFGHALPFWSSSGCDPAGHGFVEHLSLDATPAPVSYKRMRVQARQIYVFSHAALLGCDIGVEAAHRGFDFITAHGRIGEGGWARRLGPAGGIQDPTADLYDLAFVLFACAWYARAFQKEEAIDHARKTLGWIRSAMAHDRGGYHHVIPRGRDPRQQNPHMHLLEATLALYETTGDALFLAESTQLMDLFRHRFVDPESGTLREFFDEDLRPLAGPMGDHVEPGHHYEWVWLLRSFQRLTGGDLPPEALTLYDFANRHGADPQSGLVWNIVGKTGQIKDAGIRLWPQTEAVKAHLAMARSPDFCGTRIERIIDNLEGIFFAATPPGTWRDQFDADGQPIADKIPTSSLYHIFMAFAELDRTIQGSRA